MSATSISSHSFARDDSSIFQSVIAYTDDYTTYTLLPKECFNDKAVFTVGGVLISDKEDKETLQHALTAGYRFKDGVTDIKLLRKGLNPEKTIIKALGGVMLFSVVLLVIFSYVLDLASLNFGERQLVVLVPIYTALILGGLITYLAAPSNKSKSLAFEVAEVSDEQATKLRKELFRLKSRFGSDTTQSKLFLGTALLDKSRKDGDKPGYLKLEKVLRSKVTSYRDSVIKSNYYVSDSVSIGGVSYSVPRGEKVGATRSPWA